MQYLKEGDIKQFNRLESHYQDTLNYLYKCRFTESVVTLYEQTLDSATFTLTPLREDIPLLYAVSKNDVVYGNPVEYPLRAETNITLIDGKWIDTGLTPGHHIKYTFMITDALGIEGRSATSEVVFAPLPVEDLTIEDNENGTITVTFTDAVGALSNDLYWMAVTGEETAIDMMAGGTRAMNVRSDGATIKVGIGDFGFMLVTYNEGGFTNSDICTSTVTCLLSAITDLCAIYDSIGTVAITFTDAIGTGPITQILYWMAVIGEETVEDIITYGKAILEPDGAGIIINTGVGDFGFVVVATNEFGESTNSNVEMLLRR